jgi:hypothetical protein
MNREKQHVAELRALRTLCDESIPRNLRQNLIQSLGPRSFADPEHQVVFESIVALFPRGPIRAEQLRIHLNNRGFPDTDVEKYFSSPAPENLGSKRPGTRTP